MTLFGDDFYMQRAREVQKLRERVLRQEEERRRREARRILLAPYRRAWLPIVGAIVFASGLGGALELLSLSLDTPSSHIAFWDRVVSLLLTVGTLRLCWWLRKEARR